MLTRGLVTQSRMACSTRSRCCGCTLERWTWTCQCGPNSIGELAEHAKQIPGVDPRPFKSRLRIAENARTIVLEMIPARPDYRVPLSTKHRHSMGLVSYFYPMAHDCGSVGRVHFPYECIDEFIFRILHDFL
jgi:hypothetical protein